MPTNTWNVRHCGEEGVHTTKKPLCIRPTWRPAMPKKLARTGLEENLQPPSRQNHNQRKRKSEKEEYLKGEKIIFYFRKCRKCRKIEGFSRHGWVTDYYYANWKVIPFEAILLEYNYPLNMLTISETFSSSIFLKIYYSIEVFTFHWEEGDTQLKSSWKKNVPVDIFLRLFQPV